MSSSSKHLLTKAEKKDAKFQEEMQSRIQSLAMGEGIKSGMYFLRTQHFTSFYRRGYRECHTYLRCSNDTI